MGVVVTLNRSGRSPDVVSASAQPSGEGLVLQYMNPARAKIADAVARCPSLAPLVEYCAAASVNGHARRERILATLLRHLRDLPGPGCAEERIAFLCSCPMDEVCRVADVQFADAETERFHGRMLPVWGPLEGADRAFAQRCSAVLAEALVTARKSEFAQSS